MWTVMYDADADSGDGLIRVDPHIWRNETSRCNRRSAFPADGVNGSRSRFPASRSACAGSATTSPTKYSSTTGVKARAHARARYRSRAERPHRVDRHGVCGSFDCENGCRGWVGGIAIRTGHGRVSARKRTE
ncbi:hypothetical protein BU26DRAFT_268135 [Trematosphaeria pertusa]|uniref:Uncharacterized protein n=1 Tax=Trematosphaeria pertusa TaxID=390896 RepID=A0A6A6IKE4_9PLEO|nr:uncharacterized protein BU26DRAFT_268135 [Trematosphaeria pertusa]KAF2250667.1 hypothetical protein BU26DRAFT_268135 [Trematosphaeria pertusa]